jgi:hypothetical protein
MKVLKHILILVMLLYCATPVIAQQNKPSNDPPPPPPPANDYFPKKWKEFSSTDGKFKVLFPGVPKESSNVQENDVGKLNIHFVTYKSFISYSVVYTNYPRNVEESSTIKKFLDDVRDGGLSAVSKANPKIIKESDITLGGHPGRFLQVELAGNAVLRVKWIAFGERLYVVSVTTPKGHYNALGAENDYEKIAMSFLDSFQII